MTEPPRRPDDREPGPAPASGPDPAAPGPGPGGDGDGESWLPGLARGFRKRTLVTAKLATKAGFGMLRKSLRPGAGRGRTGGGADADADADRAEAVAAAEKLVAQLDGLKGIMMKFGQMASYLDGALPPAAQRVLARLQASSTPMPPDQIAAIVRAELGDEPEKCFDSFDQVPFAAASIGQVHRATLAGRELAVKVQYPGVEDALRGDLRTLGAFARVATVGSPLDGAGLLGELRERVLEECDYLNEADNQRLFAKLLADDARASVPAVIESRTARRVLTTAFAPGRSFAAFRDGASQEDRSRAGATIFAVCFRNLFTRCVFNADPHPGNYLFPDGGEGGEGGEGGGGYDGEVVFLDFGCVRRFEPEFIDRWRQFARAILDGDRRAFPEKFKALGMIGRERKFDWDYQWEVFQYLYEPFLTRGPYTYDREHVAKSYDVMMFSNPNKFKVGLPPQWLFLNRLQWGLQSVLADLGARADYGKIIRDLLEQPIEPAG